MKFRHNITREIKEQKFERKRENQFLIALEQAMISEGHEITIELGNTKKNTYMFKQSSDNGEF